jgi:hypothetical protein
MSKPIIETVNGHKIFKLDISHLTEQQVQELLSIVKQKLQEAQVPILLKG